VSVPHLIRDLLFLTPFLALICPRNLQKLSSRTASQHIGHRVPKMIHWFLLKTSSFIMHPTCQLCFAMCHSRSSLARESVCWDERVCHFCDLLPASHLNLLRERKVDARHEPLTFRKSFVLFQGAPNSCLDRPFEWTYRHRRN